MSFGILQRGQLTKKQERTLAEISKICRAFYQRGKSEPVQRTWLELKSLSEVSQGFLSLRLRELIRQGVVKKESKVEASGKVSVFYTYTEEFYEIHGNKPEPSTIDAARIYHNKSGIQAVKWGYSKRGKGKKRYFIEDKRT